MDITECIEFLEKSIKDPSKGLPEEVFLLLGRLTPYLNVDLLIKDNDQKILLTWRQPGEKYPCGWHLPGGIIRYKESFETRIKKVALSELKARVRFDEKPLTIEQLILNQVNRAHFISLLYSCELLDEPAPNLRYIEGEPVPGQWAWHQKIPKDLFIPHRMYLDFM